MFHFKTDINSTLIALSEVLGKTMWSSLRNALQWINLLTIPFQSKS